MYGMTHSLVGGSFESLSTLDLIVSWVIPRCIMVDCYYCRGCFIVLSCPVRNVRLLRVWLPFLHVNFLFVYFTLSHESINLSDSVVYVAYFS